MQERVLIVAEAGVNHRGSEMIAIKLIDSALLAKADVVKFQLYKPELLTTREEPEKYLMLKSLLLEHEVYVRLYQYCVAHHIGFACTAFDADSLQFLLDNTKMEFVKISSGQWQNKELLKLAASCGLPVIQSVAHHSHMCSLPHDNWRYLHAVPQYPTLPENAKLSAVKNLWCSGLSDHSGDIYTPIAAVALGAQIIESHITYSKFEVGPDHKASLEPHQFSEMVRGIRAIEKALA
jgi:N,N'-diacetyllegionaminate synthase